jgi:pimeloyl-ACP methyl ester carboxylesterase
MWVAAHDEMVPAKLHYVVSGNPSAHPVVFIHGVTKSMEYFTPAIITPFHTAGFQVVRIDVRGHGQSEKPATPTDTTELAADVLHLTTSLGIHRFAVVGNSMGGAIAQQLAINAPQRCSALVLACTSSRVSSASGLLYERMAQASEKEGRPGLAAVVRVRCLSPPVFGLERGCHSTC